MIAHNPTACCYPVQGSLWSTFVLFVCSILYLRTRIGQCPRGTFPHRCQYQAGSRSAVQLSCFWRLFKLYLTEERTKSSIALRDMEQASSRGHEASPQSGLSVGCKLCSSSKKLRGLGVRAQARHISTSLSFSVVRISSFLSPPRSAMKRSSWKCNAQ